MNEKEKLKETLSALFDNEAGKQDQLELRRLVRSLDDNPELIETYQRYMLTHATQKGEPLPILSQGLLNNVRAALEQETMEEVLPDISVTINKNNTSGLSLRWLKSLGRVAVAASVAVMAVYVVEHQVLSPSASIARNAATQMPAPDMVSNTVASGTAEVNEHNNRLLNPDVMTVSAGDRQPFDRPVDSATKSSPGCTIGALRSDNSERVWEKELPAGYVLCKQKDQSKQCESVTSKIGCYLN